MGRHHDRPRGRLLPPVTLAGVLAVLLAVYPQPSRSSPRPGSPLTALDTKCKPSVPASDPLPPCVEIETIEALCYPNGTGPLYLEAHAQCMCHGSYFPEWTACRRCLYLHGQLAERDLSFYYSIASSASSALCGFLDHPATAPAGGSGAPAAATGSAASASGKPTAMFRDLFTSAELAIASPTTGVASLSDSAKGNTDVALYWTATGSLGPGPITGSATGATGTGGLVVATGRPSHGTPLGGSSGGGAASAKSTGAGGANSAAVRLSRIHGWASGALAGIVLVAIS